MQSVSILSNDLCPSMLLFPFAAFLLCFPAVLSGYCIVLFYFLGILGVMKLHHSEVHGMFKLRKHGGKNFLLKPNISLVVDLEAQYSTAFRQNLQNLLLSWPIQCQWDVSKELIFDKQRKFFIFTVRSLSTYNRQLQSLHHLRNTSSLAPCSFTRGIFCTKAGEKTRKMNNNKF